MGSDKRSFGCVEYTLIVAICAMLGVILYATLQHSHRETHTSITSQPSQTAKTLTVSNRPSNPSIGNKMGHVQGATMGSTLGAIREAITTAKPIQQSVQYLPIHLHKATRTIRIIPEGQEGD
jgi:guanyl-specific ribonuclease Sa